MSLHLEFEPNGWFMGFAIKRPDTWNVDKWEAYIDNGMTGYIDSLEADRLKDLKQAILEYHVRKHTGYGERWAKRQLKVISASIEAENVSYGELALLTELADYIPDDDVNLLEWAGVPEGSRNE